MPKKQEGLPEYHPRIVGWHTGDNGITYATKKCHFKWCDNEHYARGLCHGHYEQLREGRTLGDLTRLRDIPYPECAYTGCENTAKTKTADKNYCQGHMNHIYLFGELKPLKYKKNEGFTANGRVCKDCREEKPLDEYYKRNQWKKEDSQAKSTQCKDCFKQDVCYYQGKITEKADGSDPMGWKDNPEAMRERFEAWREKRRASSARWEANRKAKNA